MASYEANEGKRKIEIGIYLLGDYISVQVIKSIFHATIAFFIVFALFVFYDLELLMADVNKMDLLDFGKRIIIYYLIFVVAYAVISYAVYAYCYAKARKSLKIYYNNLKKLAYLYDKESKKYE